MFFKSRRFFIWFISLMVVVAVYLLYSRISETPSIKVDTSIESPGTAVDFDKEIGKIGDIGVGSVQKAKYIHLNENKEIDREFGFEKLLHKTGDEWDLEKPFINIFRPNLKCYVTSDRGNVQVETTVSGRPEPKDSMLSGNVVIHIVPEDSDSTPESFIYLDDITYISERSYFTTEGPVRFVSADATMRGRGLEMVYNDARQRLEFLRIIHLDSMNLKQDSKTSSPSSSPATTADTAPVTPTQAETRKPPEPAAATADQKPTASQPKTQQARYYRCVLSKNVKIDSPEQLIFAYDKVFANNLLFSNAPDEKSTEADEAAKASGKTAQKSVTAEHPQAPVTVADSTNENSTTAVKPDEPDESPQQLDDTIITCDNGILILPMASLETNKNYAKLELQASAIEDMTFENLGKNDGRTTFVARRIDYDAITEDIIAPGSSELTFYTKDQTASHSEETSVSVTITAQKQTRFLAASNQAIFEGDCFCKMPQKNLGDEQNYTLTSPKITVNFSQDKSKQQTDLLDVYAAGPAELTFYTDNLFNDQSSEAPLPVKVTAQKHLKFLPPSNQVVFEGDSVCIMLRQHPTFLQKYTLSAPKLTINLAKDKSDQTAGPAGGIEHLTAEGGIVRLASVKTAEEKMLGGVELKCRKFDYDAPQQTLLFTGPGTIAVDNSKVPVSESDTEKKFSMQEPCYAIVRDFKTLEYLVDANQIIADAGQNALLIDYFPIVNGQYGQQTAFTARHMIINLTEAADGQSQLSTLTATGGITYDEQDKQFAGSRLFYEADDSIMTVNGDKSQPCLLNGAMVDAIRYDLKTEKIKAKIIAPGTLKRRRR